jgi:DNA polymerase-3 subunit delta
MPQISYKELEGHIAEAVRGGIFASVYLIYGEELLSRSCREELVDAMIPSGDRTLCYDPVEGLTENVLPAVRRANTFSMLGEKRVVALNDIRLFDDAQDVDSLMEKAKEAWDKNDPKTAAKTFLSLLAAMSLTLEDAGSGSGKKHLKTDDPWVDQLVLYCRENGLTIPGSSNAPELLLKAIQSGFPKSNHLIVTCPGVDKRSRLYKAMAELGVAVDCSVPKGDLKADRMIQDTVLSERKEAILARAGKTMDPRAYSTLCELTGFDLATFSDNLEKLIAYGGDRSRITREDVAAVLRRTRKDPIYELTGAVSDRNPERSLFLLKSLFSDNMVPLQILSALINQMRRMLAARDFLDSPGGKAWKSGMAYPQFQNRVMPAVVEYDRALTEDLKQRELSMPEEKTPKKGGKKNPARPATDLVVARNPKSPFPVYQLLSKADRFSRDELLDSYRCLGRADLRLKSSATDPRQVLEEAIFCICGVPI